MRAAVPLAVWAEVVRGPPPGAELADLPEPALPAGLVPQQADTVQAQASRQGDRDGGAVPVRVHDTPLKPAATGRRAAGAGWLVMLMTGSCGRRTLHPAVLSPAPVTCGSSSQRRHRLSCKAQKRVLTVTSSDRYPLDLDGVCTPGAVIITEALQTQRADVLRIRAHDAPRS